MNNFHEPATTSTTKTTITETHVQTNLRWDPNYIKTIPGILKLAAVIINLVVFICVCCPNHYWRESNTARWTYFVSMTGFWVSGILLIFYLLHVIEKFHVIPWVMIEMGYCGTWAFFYFTCALDLAVKTSQGADTVDAFGAASFFSFGAMGIYGFDAFLKFKAWRAGQLGQGERVVQQTESTAY